MAHQEGEERRQFEAMDASVDGMSILSPDYEHVYVNQAHADIHGYGDPEDILGEPWHILYDEKETERIRREAFPEVDETGGWRGEATALRSDGTEFPVELSVSRMEDGCLFCVVREVTERKEREREHMRYETFVENSSDMLVHIDEEGKVVYQSPSVEQILGCGQEERVGDYGLEYVHPEDRDELQDLFETVVKDPDRTAEKAEFRVRHTDGSYVWVEARGTDQRDTEMGGFVINLRDVTERKERGKELERYEAFVENSSDSITHLDEEGNILYRNPSSERAEDEPGEMTGSSAFEHIHPEDREHVAEKFFSLLDDPDRTTDSVEYRSERADGSYEWVEAVAADQRDTEVGGVVINTRVIEDRKKREKELERYETFVKNSSDIVSHLDEDGTVIYHSPSTERILGHGPNERIGDNAFEYVHPDDRERLMKLAESVTEGDAERAEAEFRARDGDGEYVWLEAAGTDQRDTEVGGYVVNVRDITERKEREKELERYEAFVKSTSDVVTHVDENGEIVYNSPSIEDVFGYDQDETVGDNAFGYIHPEDRERMMKAFEATVSDEGDPGDENTEFRIRDADGDYVWVEDAAGDPADTGLDGVVLNLRDITDRKEREKELERYEAFLENSLDIFSVLDEEGRHIYNSPSIERILGYDREEHTGEYSLEYVHPDDMSRTIEWFYSLVEGEKKIDETELRYRNSNGDYLWFEVIGTDKMDTEVGGVVFNAREITERKEREKELREEQKAMETVISNVPIIAFTLDEDGVFTRSQGKALSRIGLEPGEVVGESVFDFYGDSPEITENIERALSGERIRTTVEVSGRKLESWYEPLEDEDETPSGVVGMAYDVTEREEREKELERYEAFVEHSSDVVTLVEEDGTVLYFSPSVEYHAGHSPEERVGDNIYEYIHPEDKERVMETYSGLLESPDTMILEGEFRYQRGDGSYVWVEARGTDQRDTDLGGIVINARDITERKEREKELERYEAYIQNSSDVITHIDENGTVLYQSPASERILGRDPRERTGKDALEYIHPDDREEVAEKLDALFSDPDRARLETEFRTLTDDGSYVWFETIGIDKTDTEFGGIIANSRDITERKKDKEKLERSRELLRHTEEISDTGGWEFDVESQELRWTKGAEGIRGVPEEIDTPEGGFDFYHPEDRERLQRVFEHCVKEGEPYEEEVRISTEDGETRWMRTSGEAIREDGRTVKVRGAISDITEQKQREKELRRKRRLLRHTESVADTGGWEFDVESQELRWTEGTREIHGTHPDYDPTIEEAIGFYHPEDRNRIESAVERCLEGEPFDEELRLVTTEGELRWVRSIGEPICEGGEVVEMRGAIQDITERKERERRLRERKDQIDFFNSLLRHDMLNSMTVISGSAEVLKQELSGEQRSIAERISKHSAEIVELTERVRSVLRRLTEGDRAEVSPVDITDLIEERCGSLEETYPEVTCRTDSPGRVHVMADSFLNHILDNLLINAVEHNDKEDPRVEVTVEENGETVTVRVADNGPGIPEEEKETVFDQGTTGRSSGGVGFGLYYVEAMVSEYGGEVRVEDNDPEGAVLVVELPKAERGDGERKGDGKNE